MVVRVESELIGSNVFLVEKENSCIIIDAGTNVEEIKNKVKDKKVKAIFLTHGHYDHCFYINDYIKNFGCKVYANAKIKEYLESAKYNYSEGKFKIDDFSNFVFLSGEGVLNIGDFEVEFTELGGHSFSDMCYEIGEDIFVGDVLIGRDMGRIDLYGGDKDEMKESLNFLLQKDFQTMHSGHGCDNDKLTQNKVIKLWLKYLNR